jgi:large subunit ribosomal protein LP0
VPSQISKDKIVTKVADFLDRFSTVLVCEVKDLPADYIHSIRKELRTIQSEVVCGKTTVITKAISLYMARDKAMAKAHTKESLTKLSDCIQNMHIFIIFTNSDVGKVTGITNKFIVEKQARSGAISPIEVILKAGPTGMDSSQIEYFQALKIQTKVIKNQLEIITDSKILVVGQKITLSEINLMKKFNIKPYKHMVQIRHILMNGKIYGADILKINDEYLQARVLAAIQNVAAFSMQAGLPNKASVTHVIANAFKNVMGLSSATGVNVKQISAAVAVAAVAPVKVEAKKEEKKAPKKVEPEPEEEEEGGFMDMFA